MFVRRISECNKQLKCVSETENAMDERWTPRRILDLGLIVENLVTL